MSDLKHRLRYADQDLDHGNIAKVKLACWEAREHIEAQDERIKALEAGLKPFAEARKTGFGLKPWEHVTYDDWDNAASLLEEKK